MYIFLIYLKIILFSTPLFSSTISESNIFSYCLTEDVNNSLKENEYHYLIKRRKSIKQQINQLNRNYDTLYIPIVFHNLYEVIDGSPSRSFCDYQSGNNEFGIYSSNNDTLICLERAEKTLEILNQQFSKSLIKFIEPKDTLLIVHDIKKNNDLFIWNENWNSIKRNYNISNVLNIYLDYCLGKNNSECGSTYAWTSFPGSISENLPQGIAIKHSQFPHINNNYSGILAHEIGHVFTLLHLYHVPLRKNESGLFEIDNSNFDTELVSGQDCNSRGDLICDTPGQPLLNVYDTFDLDNCIYHGFGGHYNSVNNILKIGGYESNGNYSEYFETNTNIICNSNQDDTGNYWGTRDIPDSCFLNYQNQFSSNCIDSAYNFLPIASNYLQNPIVMESCLTNTVDGFTEEQSLNIRESILLDYTACNDINACNYDFSIRKNITSDMLLRFAPSSCLYACDKFESEEYYDNFYPGCNSTEPEYSSNYLEYECQENLKNINIVSPNTLNLVKIYPNPFNPITKINYYISINGYIEINIYNLSGQLITNLYNDFQKAGQHSIFWDAKEYTSGIYFIKLNYNNQIIIKKILLIK